MELKEALAQRTSVRAYTGQGIDRQAILEIIEAGVRAPSALNQQPWAFAAVTTPALISELAEHAAGVRDMVAEKSGKEWMARYDTTFLSKAGAVIIVSADPSKIGMGKFLDEEGAHVKAAAAAIENMLLAIADAGLASLWFTMYDKGYLKEKFGIPAGHDIVGMLPVGVPAGPAKPLPRKSAEEVTTFF